MTKKEILLLGLILGLGLVVRIAPIIHHQVFFWFDQGLDQILVKNLVIDHHLSLTSRYSGLAGVLMGPLWTWILAVPFVLGRGDPAANTVFFAVVSLLAAFLGYRLFRGILSTETRVISLVLFAFSPVIIAASQISASPHPLSFLFIFYLWFLYQAAVGGRSVFLWPLFFLAGVFFQLEIGFALFALLAIFVVLIVFRKWGYFKNRYFWLGIVFLGVTFIPQILFDIRHQFLISQGLIKFLTGGGSSLYGAHNPLWFRFWERTQSFWEDYGRMVPLPVPFLVLAVWGWLKKEGNYSWLKLLATVLGTFYVGFSLYPGPLWEWYRVGLPIVYILFIAIGLGEIWKKNQFSKLIIGGLLFVYALQGSKGEISGGDNANLKNQLTVVDYVYQKAGGAPFSYFAYTPPVYDYVWAYGFWWYGQKKYGYLPNNWQMTVPLLGIGKQLLPPKPNEGRFFVILEPNYQRPWEPAGWLTTYIKYGRVVARQEFPGKIIVEERNTD